MSTDLTTPSSFERLQRLVGAVMRGERPLFALFQTVGAQGVILTANLLTGIITARLLGPEGRGEYAAVSVWPQLLATIAMAGMSSAIVFRMRTVPAQAGAIAGAALLTALGLGALAVGLGVVLLPLLMKQYSPALTLFAQLCLVSVFVNVIHMVLKQTLAGSAQYARSNLTNLLPQVLYLPALLLLIPLGDMTPRGAVLALLISGAVAVLIVLPPFLRTVRPRFKGAGAELRPLLHYSTRAWLGELVFALATYADRLVLIPMLNPAELGLYAVAFSFSRIVQLAQPAILLVFFSQLSGRKVEDSKRLHDHALRLLLVTLFAACVLLWFAGEVLLSFAFGAEFAAATLIFRLLAIEAAIGVLSQVTVQLFLSCDRPGIISTLQGAVLALSLALLLVLVPAYGALGAAMALLIAGAVRWIALMVAIPMALKLPRPRFLLQREDLQFMLRRLR
jgi:antigen flippase